MRNILALLALTLVITGCKTTPDKPIAPPSTPRWTQSIVGYGVAWDWDHQKPKQLADVLDFCGANATLIEIDFRQSPQFVADWCKPFRDKKITVEICVVNFNTASSIAKPTAEFQKYFQDLKAALKTTDYIIMNPGAEPGNRNKPGDKAKVQSWIKYVLDNWSGKTALSTEFEWAKPFAGRVTYQEKHWCKDLTESTVKTGNWINTGDCTPLIGASPQRVFTMTKAALKKRAHWIDYDASWDSLKPGAKPETIDYGRLDAIKRAIEEAS